MTEEQKKTKLKYVESMHEQREMHPNIIPSIGGWLEVGKFTKVIETFETLERYECTGINTDDKEETITVRLKKLDLIGSNKRSAAIAKQIVEKHGDKLATTLMMGMVKIGYNKKGEIRLYKTRLQTKSKAEYIEKRDEILGQDRTDKLKATVAKKKELLQKAEDRLKNWQEVIDNEKNNSR